MNDKLYIKKFIRDDGETLAFDADEIYLAQENTLLTRPDPQTSAVEYTEADGGEMIHQQNAIYEQPINGLIIPKNKTYWELMTILSKFFRVNHYYKIIYTKKSGEMFAISSAWISSGLQVVPVPHEEYSSWSITFAIGNTAWTEYAEDSSGKEIYSNNIVLPLLTADAGGEIWETSEKHELTAEGTSFTINSGLNTPILTDVQLIGDTTQQTYSGKNVVDFSTISFSGVNGGNGTRNGETYTITDGGTNSGGIQFTESDLQLEANTTYTFSAKVVSTTSTQGSLVYINNSMSASGSGIFGNLALAGQISQATFTTPGAIPNNASIRIYTRQANTTAVFTDIQVEKGSTATPYEPFVGGTASPSPSYPQTVNTVTGEQTVTVSDDNNQSQSFTIDLGSIELCKIGTYQDYIYTDGTDWYVHQAIGKITYTGNSSENWQYSSTSGGPFRIAIPNAKYYTSNNVAPLVYCDYYTPAIWNSITSYSYAVTAFNNNVLPFRNTDITSLDAWKTWLSSHNTTVYYPFATPTDTKITNANLITNLEALASANCYAEQTNFVVTASGLPGILAIEAEYYTSGGEKWDSIGGEWESGSGGVQTITIDSTQNVYPMWTVKGPCVNPLLQNNTTDTVATYAGTVASGQTLVVDFEAGTAHLNSALVTRYVTGLVSLAPGENTIGFNSDGGTTETSTISWNNIIN